MQVFKELEMRESSFKEIIALSEEVIKAKMKEVQREGRVEDMQRRMLAKDFWVWRLERERLSANLEKERKEKEDLL